MIYLSIPLFAEIKDDKKIKVFSYLVIISIIINALIPFIIHIFNIPISYKLSFQCAAGPIIYVLLGYIFANIKISSKTTNCIYILSIIGLIAHIVGTYILSMDAGKIIHTYKGYYNIPCILYSLGIFLFFKNHCEQILKNKIINSVVLFLQNYTLPIYLLHWFILDFMKPNLTYAINRLGLPFVIIPICVILTIIIRKNPYLKRVLP